MSPEWLTLIQGTAFPIVACIALAVFTIRLLGEYRKEISNLNKDNRDLIQAISSTNNEMRRTDSSLIVASIKENTEATYELAKAIGMISVRLETPFKRET